MIEIDGVARLDREVFGPVLHVLRFDREELPALIDAINATGYGLTHGIQSRIDETVDGIVARIRAGNIYVNRNVIGAVVGVQPFGGTGLSGTGPKAGGPLYLRRLVRQTEGAHAPLPHCSISEPLRGRLVELIAGSESLASHERARLLEVVRSLPDAAGLGSAMALPGPTGESNRWSLHPRGRVGCIAQTDDELALQIIVALAAGNCAIVAGSLLGKRAVTLLGVLHCELSEDVLASPPDAIVVAGGRDFVRQCRVRAAAGEGRIVPVIARDAMGGYDVGRLLIEKVVTINTTASGGNAELLAIAG